MVNFFYVAFILIIFNVTSSNSAKDKIIRKTHVIELTRENIDGILASNELVVIYFYTTTWTSYPGLDRDYENIAETLSEEITEKGKIVLGKVKRQLDFVATKFGPINYITFKIVKNGQIPHPNLRYRGDYNFKDIYNYIEKETRDPIKKLQEVKNDTNAILGFFKKNQTEYEILRRVAMNLKERCDFYAYFDDAKTSSGLEPLILFRPESEWSNGTDVIYKENKSDFNQLFAWASEKCSSLIREITTDHPEDLKNNEYLPYLILYHDPGDRDTVGKFRKTVQEHLISEKNNISFATATIGKYIYNNPESENIDIEPPAIVIDSPKHMYTFPNTTENMDSPEKIKQFIYDLDSEVIVKLQVTVGIIDCGEQHLIATSFNIAAYPTVKLVVKGQLVKEQCLGERCVDAFAICKENFKKLTH